MRGLINNKTLSDVTFLVEGKEIYANRAILATRSAYFHALLFGVGMKESVQTCEEAECNLAANERKPIVVEDISHPVFMKMIEYIYTDSLFIKKELLTEVGIPLLIASEKFMLDRLKAICEDKLRKHVNADNVSGILLTSHRHNANGLKDISLEVIMSNLNSPTVMNSLTVSV
jgi:speckle-type POZ protein